MTVSYQPYPVGYTAAYWDIPLETDEGVDDLTNVSSSNITLYFRADGSSTDVAGTGTLSIKAVYPAEILYKPSVADVASPFVGDIVIKALLPPSNTIADQAPYDPIRFIISPA